MKCLLKKALSLAVVLAIILSCFTVNASAMEYYGQTVSVGDVVSTEEYGDSVIDLIFTPEESGLYVYYSMGDYDTVGYVCDTMYNELFEGDDYEDFNFYIVCYLTAGETYILQSQPFDDYDCSYSVCIEKSDASIAEEVFIFHGGETTGYVDNYLTFECMGEPEGSYVGSCYWESDNEDVAVIDYTYDNFCDVYFVGTGTANITVTTEFGLTDSIEVSCIDIPEIELDSPQYISFGTVGGVRYFKFFAEEDGLYAAYSNEVEYPGISVYDSDWNSISTSMLTNVSKFALSAGEYCYIEVSPFFEESEYNIFVTECIPAESVDIIGDETVSYYPGLSVSFFAYLSPTLAADEQLIWSVSDGSVASLVYDEEEASFCELTFKKAGKVTLSVSTASGLTDSVELECKEPETIKLDEKKTCSADKDHVFKFVPEKSGTYVFYSEGELDVEGEIFDKDWNLEAIGNDVSGTDLNFTVQCNMLAGKTYYLSSYVFSYYDYSGEEYTVSVSAATAPTDLFVGEGSDFYGFVGDWATLSAVFAPITAKNEMCSFTSSDESVVAFQYKDEDFCTIDLVGEGTATVTITSKSGLSASIDVHVRDISYKKLSLGEKVSVEKDAFIYSYFEFTPEEDGVYSFLSMGDTDTYVEYLDSDDFLTSFDSDSGEGFNFCYQLEMEAGETYRFSTGYSDLEEASAEYTVLMVKSDKAESIKISDESTINCSVGDFISLSAEFLPYGSEFEEIHWRISDRSVIEIYYETEYTFDFLIIGEGIAEVEAFTDNGHYACVTIVAGDVLIGDVNCDGDVNSIDTNMLKRYIAGAYMDINTVNADVNCDGSVDSRDSNMLRRTVAGQ